MNSNHDNQEGRSAALPNDGNKNTSQEFIIHYSACAFVDILGQRAQLKKFDNYELGPDLVENADFQALVANTVGCVNKLHDSFFDFFDAYHAKRDTNIPDEHSKYWDDLTKIDLSLTPFSDGFILSVPLMHDREVLPLYGLASLFHSLCSAMLYQLATHTSIRGGVEIGTEVQLRKNVRYGSAIAKAYDLESNVAIYPRIVIGLELVNYIHTMETVTPEHVAELPFVTNFELYSKLTNSLATVCKEMMIQDFDGNMAIHYLSPYILDGLEDEKLCSVLVRNGYDYIVEQANTARNNRNTKVALKYNHLLQYYETFGGSYIGQ